MGGGGVNTHNLAVKAKLVSHAGEKKRERERERNESKYRKTNKQLKTNKIQTSQQIKREGV